MPAWPVVESTQHAGSGCWLITQPDHAALAGDLARQMGRPALEAEVIEAIGLHDEGWGPFDEKELRSAAPRSFLAMSPAEFVQAWTASIERAQQASAIGGILVSRHFCRLAQDRLESGGDRGEDLGRLRGFLAAEERRQGKLFGKQRRPQEAVEALVDVLQFCDLVSLYLCGGASADVEFPQALESGRARLRWEREACVFEPSPFPRSFDLAVAARRHREGRLESMTFNFFVW